MGLSRGRCEFHVSFPAQPQGKKNVFFEFSPGWNPFRYCNYFHMFSLGLQQMKVSPPGAKTAEAFHPQGAEWLVVYLFFCVGIYPLCLSYVVFKKTRQVGRHNILTGISSFLWPSATELLQVGQHNMPGWLVVCFWYSDLLVVLKGNQQDHRCHFFGRGPSKNAPGAAKVPAEAQGLSICRPEKSRVSPSILQYICLTTWV